MRPEQRSSRDTEGGRRLPVGIATAILQTLKYSDHFGFPLTLDEIHLRLVGARRASPASLTRVIKDMLKKNLIQKTGNFYHLPGRSSLVAHRLKRAKLSAPQLSLAYLLSSRISRLKSILAIYLTGSLAMNNSDGDSDIDFMIITQNNRLWTTRLLLTIYTTILGVRRTPYSQKNSGKLCLNLYLTPTTYDLPSTKRSLYTAYELVQAAPLYDPHNTRSSLLASNPWIYKYLPNVTRTVLKRNSRLQVEKGSAAAERTVLYGTLNIIEKLAYWFQKFYMHNKITRELVTPHSAFFHSHDPSPKV